jgi:hypothetical protein
MPSGMDVGFGTKVNPLRHWPEYMANGNDILGDIATVLTLPTLSVEWGDGTVSWVWPAVSRLRDPTYGDWQTLLPLYPQEVIDQRRTSELGYIGLFFVSIGEDGIWAGRNLGA